MGSLWNVYYLLPLLLPFSLYITTSSAKNAKEKPKQLFQERHDSSSAPTGENNNIVSQVFSWPLSSSEDIDRQGVIGEYTDTQESAETALLLPEGRGLQSSHVISATKDTISELSGPTSWTLSWSVPQNQDVTSNVLSRAKSIVSTLPSAHRSNSKPTVSSQSPLPSLLSGLLPSYKPDQDSPSLPSADPVTDSESHTQSWADNWRWAKDKGKQNEPEFPNHTLSKEAVTGEKDVSGEDHVTVSETSDHLLLGFNAEISTTTCGTSDQSWTSTYPDDLTHSDDSLRSSLALTPALLVPLYSDWNSAFASWGFAWEAHIYGLGSVFFLLGLISGFCLLSLLLQCPPGIVFFTVLHFFILAFTGIQSFGLLYDAYSSQDRLPPLATQLLSALPSPCLISAFSLAFLLLSLHSHSHLSLPVVISASCSALPNPCFVLSVCLLHFLVSLACVGLLQLFQRLPVAIIVVPQCLFVLLTIFLLFSYFTFCCLRQIRTRDIYRLNDNGESGGSPEVMRYDTCPFSDVKDVNKAVGVGLGSLLCLLGCGSLQLYGILHSLGFGGVDGHGFQPWPWLGYQTGCRFCEIGVCLGLSIIGIHPLLSKKNSSTKTLRNARPGSWSRLSCSSPLRGLSVPSQDEPNSPVILSLDLISSWSQSKQEEMHISDVVHKRQSESFPSTSSNGVSFAHKCNLLPLLTPPKPTHKPRNIDELPQSSLDNMGAESDSTGDLRPPSPINLSRSIDHALFSESLFSQSIFGPQRLFQSSSIVSLKSASQGTIKQVPRSVGEPLYRTSSCGDMNPDKSKSKIKAPQPNGSLRSHGISPKSSEQMDWKGSITGSTQGLCSHPKETGKLRSNSWTNKGQNFAQSSFPRAIPQLSCNRRYRTLSLASQHSQGSGRLAGTKQLSESKQLEWDIAVQAEFVKVCKQIDSLSVGSDTIEL